jgi:eukaryotic-like serine/threonine-protein kinase
MTSIPVMVPSMSKPEAKLELLNDRYQMLDLIGKGAMGRVYKARDMRLGGALVAVKVLSKGLISDKMCDRFRNEASICAQLGQKSIHIVRVSDYDFDSDGVPYYVMEYLQGDGLNEIVRKQPLELRRFLSMMRQICLGLQAAHQGIDVNGALCPIIHRDIKPSNMLVMQDQSLGELVKVLDFGISKVLQEDANQTSTFMGTMVYSSPEQMEGRELDARSDIYSLGIMMFEMLTGQIPLQAETHTFAGWYRAHTTQPPKALKVAHPGINLPRALESLVMGCLAKEAKDRPQSVIEILKQLEPLEEHYSIGRQRSQASSSPTPVSAPDITRQTGTIEDSSEVKTATPRLTMSVVDELYHHAVWPKDKPNNQLITFTQPLEICQKRLPLVWAMLPDAEVQQIRMHQMYNRTYKNMICLPSPHPMALWMTALYNRAGHPDRDPRWFPQYLDLSTPQGQDTLRLLGERGRYHLLLFAQGQPDRCALVVEMPFNAQLQSLIQEWSILSATWRSVSDATTSKGVLKAELDKLKTKFNPDLKRFTR